MLALGIETSCDETSAAVVEETDNVDRPWRIRSNVVASQVAIHREWGGVVPELSARQHIRDICGVVERALDDAHARRIDAVAVTQGPGLVGSLLVGVSFAKAFAWTRGIPVIPVHHLAGHIESLVLQAGEMPMPAVVLVVSGGHTSLYRISTPGVYELLGRTRDDAAGEAFDKVAKLLHLGYPGGPIIDRLSRRGNARAVDLPLSKISDGKLDFSFSGIKTAVVRYVQANLQEEVSAVAANRNEPDFHNHLPQAVYDLIASFQRTAIEMLFDKTARAAEVRRPKSVLVSGGVACNSQLRDRFHEGFAQKGIPVHFPSP